MHQPWVTVTQPHTHHSDRPVARWRTRAVTRKRGKMGYAGHDSRVCSKGVGGVGSLKIMAAPLLAV